MEEANESRSEVQRDSSEEVRDEDCIEVYSKVLKALQLRLKGSKPEIKMSNAVVLYDHICQWYEMFLQTEEADRWIQRFNQVFPEYKSLRATKKIDFILWAS